eukprot:scaffold21791_cov55-Phaeocystis_antarctica.AAC.4
MIWLDTKETSCSNTSQDCSNTWAKVVVAHNCSDTVLTLDHKPCRRRPPLRRPRDAQRRLLGYGEVAQVHLLATAPHRCLEWLEVAGPGEAHAAEARLTRDQAQRQPLHLRLLARLLTRH